MATLQEQLENIQNLIASGANEVSSNDGTVEDTVKYKSLEELLEIERYLIEKINASNRVYPRYQLAKFT